MAGKIAHTYNNSGFFGLIQKAVLFVGREIQFHARNIYFAVVPAGKFDFNGKPATYFRHAYNNAFDNERTIEIPIVQQYVDQLPKNARILEVGNVLSNYPCNLKREILDKYDSSPCVTFQQDIVDFKPTNKYDLIIGISTFEHVGWDEDIKDPKKIEQSLRNLREHALNPKGLIVTTFPLGYNSDLDFLMDTKGTELFTEAYFLKRTTQDNQWKQVKYADVKGAKFDQPFNNANAMVIGIIRAT